MKQMVKNFLVMFAVSMLLAGCQNAYFGAMEKVGIHKRDIMVDRVTEAKESQQEAKEEFSSALEEFQTLLGSEDTDLQDQYDELSDKFEDSENAANEVRERIEAVEDVSEALFEEWQDELELYSSAKLRQESAAKLRLTKNKYGQLITAMKAAEKRMDPVLNALRDQVLYLKHNLNARAIDGLKGELSSIESNVAQLIKDMEKSIAESEEFIAQLEQG